MVFGLSHWNCDTLHLVTHACKLFLTFCVLCSWNVVINIKKIQFVPFAVGASCALPIEFAVFPGLYTLDLGIILNSVNDFPEAWGRKHIVGLITFDKILEIIYSSFLVQHWKEVTRPFFNVASVDLFCWIKSADENSLPLDAHFAFKNNMKKGRSWGVFFLRGSTNLR